MRILITGGAGCLGSNLIDHYVPEGHEILVIDSFVTGKRGNVPAVDGVNLLEGSMTDMAFLEKAFSSFRPEIVIHSAAAYKDPSDWISDSTTNVLGTINVVQASQRFDVNRLIHFQTALCYGRPETVPIPVNHPLAPFTSYGISKAAGEQYLMMSGIPYVSLRLANITGPRLAIGPIPTFYKRLKAGQSCFCSDTVRDFLDMEDFFSLMDQVVQPDAPTGVYNVSTGVGHTIEDVFNTVVAYLGITLDAPVPVVPAGEDDVPAVVLDPTETEKIFSWKAKIGFQDTINRMLAWYDEHGVTDVFSHLATPDASNR